MTLYGLKFKRSRIDDYIYAGPLLVLFQYHADNLLICFNCFEGAPKFIFLQPKMLCRDVEHFFIKKI